MKYTTFVISASLILSVAGCKKKDEAATAGKATAASKEPAAAKAPVALAWVAIPTLGLSIEVPGDAKPDGTGDSASILVDSAPSCVVMIYKEDPDMPGNFEKTVSYIKEGKMGNGKLKGLSKEEGNADGSWKLEWTAEGITPADTTYGVDYRVIIDGTAYSCSRIAESAEGQACVAHACASLKKG